jgi:hypothetical protein
MNTIIAFITKDFFTLLACFAIFIVLCVVIIKVLENNADFFIKLSVVVAILLFVYFFYIGYQNKTVVIPTNITIPFIKR